MMQRTLTAVGVMMVVAGLPARGEPIIFDNRDGEFVWEATCDSTFVCPLSEATHLDIALSPSQNGQASETTFSVVIPDDTGSPHWSTRGIARTPDFPPGIVQIAADDDATTLIGEDGFPGDFYFARELGPDDVVDGGMNFVGFGHLCVENAYAIPLVLEWIELPAYVGLSFIRNGELHYGWVLIDSVLEGQSCQYNAGYIEPLLWAYEPAAETPITIPDLSCPGDLNGDTIVGIDDFLMVLGSWGGDIGIDDFLNVIGNWGLCPLH